MISPAKFIVSEIPCCVRQLFSCFPHDCSIIEQECEFSVLLLTSKAISPAHAQLPLPSSGALTWTEISPGAPLLQSGGWKPCTPSYNEREMLLSCYTAFAIYTKGTMQITIMFLLI